ncbi:MAG: TIM-barrel domain-containing protein [Eubacterium sp.]
MLKESLIAKTQGKANKEQTVIIDNIRITYLTPCLIRVEADEFTDLASQTVWFRAFEAGEMKVNKSGNRITVETEKAIFTIKKNKPYSVLIKDTGNTEIFSKQKNLKGTRRTLDQVSGGARLDDGLITENGAFLLDDSNTMLLDNEGLFVPRKRGKDYYAFAYGKDYRGTIQAFYSISSPVPIIPRYALGVWWSRYHAYTQKEYLDLMAEFKKRDIPLTVATVDMDWHWVHNIKDKFGVKYNGWTGYSWNKDLFPDYKEFLRKLKEQNLHITLNLHPADGVHCYEDMYEDMAKAVGIDPATKKKIDFKCGSDDFWNAYFDILHKPYERDGVDFWWIDWQQGKTSEVKGLDPLPALNHYHTLDNAEDGRMPMILSRYAGLGSHRYPLGFSGDTYINWKTLNFQPYFTATAANAAYSWWSHDIGGHHWGERDDDLYIRWLQFGVFSPIMRLHSTATPVLGKEPWKYRSDVYKEAKRWLNLRHRMIPYIFTMDHRTHSEGIALCEPMYYSYPDDLAAYCVKNQYMFGSELICAPITHPQHKEIEMGSTQVYVPKGRWVDIFTGQAYENSGIVTMFRDLDSFPVLAKEGAIIPMSADKGNKVDNPQKMEIWAFSGNGEFTLVEDNSKTDFAQHLCKTKMTISYADNKVTFTVGKPEGDTEVIPAQRDYKIIIKDLERNGEPVVMELKGCTCDREYSATVDDAIRVKKMELADAVIHYLSRWQQKTAKKRSPYRKLEKCTTPQELLSALPSSGLPKAVAGALREYLAQA